MRTFTVIAAAAAIAFGLATAPAMADSYSSNHSTTAHKSLKQSGHYQGQKYSRDYGYKQVNHQARKYKNRYSYNHRNNQGHGYERRLYYREGDRGRYRLGNRYGWPRFVFGLSNSGSRKFGYGNYGYNAPKLSKTKLIRQLKRQRFSHIKRIKYSHGFYNVFARDRHGHRVKLKVDPYTGRIVTRRRIG
jgi:hypothetical protein